MKKRKLIAPIGITVVLIVYFCFYAWLCLNLALPVIVKVMGVIIPVMLMGVSVYVLMERIQEIRSGEEDDLSEY